MVGPILLQISFRDVPLSGQPTEAEWDKTARGVDGTGKGNTKSVSRR
jgi:hypothetical protein